MSVRTFPSRTSARGVYRAPSRVAWTKRPRTYSKTATTPTTAGTITLGLALTGACSRRQTTAGTVRAGWALTCTDIPVTAGATNGTIRVGWAITATCSARKQTPGTVRAGWRLTCTDSNPDQAAPTPGRMTLTDAPTGRMALSNS